MRETITTYEPDNSLKKGYLNIFKEILIEIKENRWLTFQLFKRDFLAIYRQSFIGVLWAVVVPFVSVGTFVLLAQADILVIGDIGTPYIIYSLLGMAFWQLFATGLIAGSNSLVNAGPMIVKINFSKKSLVMASTGQSIVSFLIQFTLAIILLLVYKIPPHTSIFLIPILVIPIFFITLGFSFILSIVNGIMRDIGNGISVIITFFMFLTPILYLKPSSGILAWITSINPIYYLISGPRELILSNTISDWYGFVISSFFSFIILVFALIVFHLTETRVTERI
ncbi:MAG: ABC transporter permease [Candidatus Hodarchaeota archaeon]